MLDTPPYSTVAVLVGAYVAWRALSSWQSLAHIPTVGGSDLPILSWIGAFRYLFNGKALAREGYAKHKGGAYKVAALEGWKVILCNPELIDEAKRLPDTVLSFLASAEEFLQTEHIVSYRAAHDMHHADLVKTVMPKKLDSIFPDVYDEIAAAFTDNLPSKDEAWTTVNANDITRQVICRASNRMLVGLPLCRDSTWVNDNIAFTTQWVLWATAIRVFPKFLRGTVVSLISPIRKKIAHARDMLHPTVEQHQLALQDLEPGHPDRPNDFLAWMLENTKDDVTRTETQILTEWIKGMNFASVETSSISFTHALYDLAARPELLEPLREEAQRVIGTNGWTKTAMSELVKLDSFMRESARVNMNSSASGRKSLKQHTFSNGVTIPAGITVEMDTCGMEDEEVYLRADKFEPFRHVGKDSSAAPKQFTTIGPDYLTFGLGRHACPGRFFASLEIKAMLAHLVLNYDLKAEVEGVRPANINFAAQVLPNRDAKVLFRTRQA